MPTAPQLREITTDEVRNFSVDFTDALDVGELLTGTPTIESAAAFVVTAVQINAAAMTINGRSVAAGCAVVFSASCPTRGKYHVDVLADTDADQTIEGRIVVNVVASPN